MNRGQIHLTFATGLAVVSFVAAPVVAFFSAQASTQQEIADLSSRSAVLENSVENIEVNVVEIKDDIKDLKIYFNIK